MTLAKGVNTWNTWRKKHPDITPDLSAISSRSMAYDLKEAGARLDNLKSPVGSSGLTLNLHGVNFEGTDLSGVDFRDAGLTHANFRNSKLSMVSLDRARLDYADFRGANLNQVRFQNAVLFHAMLERVDLQRANLCKANLAHVHLAHAVLGYAISGGTIFCDADLKHATFRNSILWDADFTRADMSGADLTGSDLTRAIMVETNLTGAKLTNCRVYGTSVWKAQLDEAQQNNLIISPEGDHCITVDRLDMAQFLWTLVNNRSIRHVIDAVTTKAVLILGRFTPERIKILDEIRDYLRKRDLIPILFDFAKPTTRDLTETIGLLAHLCRLVVADLTDAKSIPQELSTIIPFLPSVLVQPVLHCSQDPYGMFEHFQRYASVRAIFRYETIDDLIKYFDGEVLPLLRGSTS
jgi:uncharacterized protein YjbI with pentapeptide repeats